MIIVVITCAVVIAVLVVANFRLRTRGEGLVTLALDTAEQRDAAQADAREQAEVAKTVRLQRDEALDRVTRSRRDAAEVANRLSVEAAAREAAELELESVRRELEETRSAGGLAELLWDLSLRQTEATWRLSIAVDSSAPSPLEGSVDPFRTAVEIAVDAAREESGAALELEWSGEAAAPPHRAVVALALVRDVIDEVGTAATDTTLRVACLDAAVEITVVSVDADGEPISVPIPAQLRSKPGSARVC